MRKIVNMSLVGLMVGALTAFSACKEKRGELKPIRYIGSYNRDFNDLNEIQLAEAQRIGVSPLATREAAGHASRKMTEIESGDWYEVEKLSYSIPFLIPEAAGLLETIGRNFIDSLQRVNAPAYRILVTSVTRTEEDVKKLRRRNLNASANSAHRYGTTFDVSWNRFVKVSEKDTLNIPPEKLKMVLASVLRDLRSAKACYVKHERKQGCFHITVRKKEK